MAKDALTSSQLLNLAYTVHIVLAKAVNSLCCMSPTFSFLSRFVLDHNSDYCQEEHPLGKKWIKTAKCSITNKKFVLQKQPWALQWHCLHYFSCMFSFKYWVIFKGRLKNLLCEVSHSRRSLVVGRPAICIIKVTCKHHGKLTRCWRQHNEQNFCTVHTSSDS